MHKRLYTISSMSNKNNRHMHIRTVCDFIMLTFRSVFVPFLQNDSTIVRTVLRRTERNACTTDSCVGTKRLEEIRRYKTLRKLLFVSHESQQKNRIYSSYKRQRILHYDRLGHRAPTLRKLLREEGLSASRVGIHKFLQKYRETKSIQRRPGSGRPTKITTTVKEIVERKMREDDEATAVQLHALLVCSGYTNTLYLDVALLWAGRSEVAPTVS